MATEPKANRSMTKTGQLRATNAPKGRVSSGAQNSQAVTRVPFTIKLVASQTGDAMQVVDSTDAVLMSISAAGAVVPAAGSLAIAALAAGSITEDKLAIPATIGLGALRVAHMKYDFAVDGGAQGEIIPVGAPTLPAKAIAIGGIINVTTAVLATGGAANVSIGTHAGSSATSIKGATAKATYALNALLATVPVFTAATAFKMSAAGQMNITVDTNDLTAGVFEVFIVYFVTGT